MLSISQGKVYVHTYTFSRNFPLPSPSKCVTVTIKFSFADLLRRATFADIGFLDIALFSFFAASTIFKIIHSVRACTGLEETLPFLLPFPAPPQNYAVASPLGEEEEDLTPIPYLECVRDREVTLRPSVVEELLRSSLESVCQTGFKSFPLAAEEEEDR